MQYLVRLTDRALHDMELLFEFIEADASEAAFVWFNQLTEAISGLERYPDRGAVIPESKKLRHLLFGKKRSIYRIIYSVDKRNAAVNILHIRHAARAPLSRRRAETSGDERRRAGQTDRFLETSGRRAGDERDRETSGTETETSGRRAGQETSGTDGSFPVIAKEKDFRRKEASRVRDFRRRAGDERDRRGDERDRRIVS